MKHPFRTPLVVVVTVVLAIAIVVGLYLWRSLSGQVLIDAPTPRLAAEGADTLDRPPASIVQAPVKYDLGTAVHRHLPDSAQRQVIAVDVKSFHTK